MKSNLKIIIFYVVLIGGILVATTLLFGKLPGDEVIYSDIVELFKEEKVQSFEVDSNNELNIKTVDGKTVSFALRSLELFRLDVGDLIEEQHEKGIIKEYNYKEPARIPWWVNILPYLFLAIVVAALWIFMVNQANGKGGKMNSFGRARAKLHTDANKKVFFDDVAGADEEKEELQEVVEFLKDPTKFSKLGARIPRGVLLVGPPGTGKTLLAKAVAGEAGVPFFSISGSDFVEMYVGVGASRVRDLFDTAKKAGSSIIFIDEIDAVGRHRGAGLGGGHDEREQTLNQLLVEMDGFGSNEGVIVMAATNRPDILDPALLRPGRFDRQITVNYPDIKGREEILKVHARNKPMEEGVDLSVIAKTTVGFTGADLANLLNEAALLAARKGKSIISMEDIESSITKVIVGPKKRSRLVTEYEKKLTAYHEAGHAIVTYAVQPDTPVHQISIIPAGRAGGYTLSLPKEDRAYSSKKYMESEIATLLGGRVAEELILGDISTGASNDIDRATRIAKNMVKKYGMSTSLGPIVYGSGHSQDEIFLGRDFNTSEDYSDSTAAKIDEEIKNIIDTGYQKAKEALEANKDKLHFIAEYLIGHEEMDEDQFKRAMGENPTVEELENILKEKKLKSEEANKVQEKINEEKEEKERAERERIERERLEAEEREKDENK